MRQLSLEIDADVVPKVWRPIHYLGSKLRLTNSIRAALDDLDPSMGTVCDLFAGSGTVAMALSRYRNVIASDIQEYSRIICTALLLPNDMTDDDGKRVLHTAEVYYSTFASVFGPILELEKNALRQASTNPQLLCDVVESGALVSGEHCDSDLRTAWLEVKPNLSELPTTLLTTLYFGGVYFSFHQSLYIDSVLAAIDGLASSSQVAYLAALLSTASSLVNSVGKQFAQPIRPRRKDGTIKQFLIHQMCRDRQIDARKTFGDWLEKYRNLPKQGTHHVICGDYREVLSRVTDISVVYADPPYTRDHYSRFYHVLETLCLRDFPAISTTSSKGDSRTSRGVYRMDRHQSPFCIKSQAPSAFNDLFVGCKRLRVPLLLSYSPFIQNGHPRLMSVEAIRCLASEFYKHVDIVQAQPVAHSKLNKAELHLNALSDAEVLVMCYD